MGVALIATIRLSATMPYPDGIISPDDEGELKIACYLRSGKVVIDFGKEVSWIGFDKQSLAAFVAGLTQKLKELE